LGAFKRAKTKGLPQKKAMNFTKNIGMLLLAIYLICVGLVGLLGLSLGIVPAILAILAGIFILIGR
jgi:D-serine dehydratase